MRVTVRRTYRVTDDVEFEETLRVDSGDIKVERIEMGAGLISFKTSLGVCEVSIHLSLADMNKVLQKWKK